MDALENLEVWTRSKTLAVNIYKSLYHCRDFGFKNQITRAAISIPSNIAEGYERHSKREFARYLKISKGSCAELRTQIIIGAEIGHIDKSVSLSLGNESLQISKMIYGLIKHCENR